MRPRLTLVSLAAAIVLAGTAAAQAEADSNALRASGAVGETAAGYMAATPGGSLSAEAKREMDQINIKRRAFYTQKAGETGLTVAQFAQNSACAIFKTSLQPGQWYRDEGGAWRQRGAGPTPLPSWCTN
jgi:uncharacterized protein YdbL (DUF1318 family)